MGKEVTALSNHIKSDDLCDRCKYGQCAGMKDKPCGDCPMDIKLGCQCDFIGYGTPCKAFEEAEDENH